MSAVPPIATELVTDEMGQAQTFMVTADPRAVQAATQSGVRR